MPQETYQFKAKGRTKTVEEEKELPEPEKAQEIQKLEDSIERVEFNDKNEYDDETPQANDDSKEKSFYETFMDVSSIFANPIFKKEDRSRFIKEEDEELEEPDYQGQAQSIFSGGNLFQSRNYNSGGPGQIGQPLGGGFYGSYDSNKESNAGLSSSSFANLRKRALDADRQEQPAEQTKKPLFTQLGGMGALPVPKFIQERKMQQQDHEEQQNPDDDDFQSDIFSTIFKDSQLLSPVQIQNSEDG